MNVLVVGAGGREHALAWKARQSSAVTGVFVAPGNAGSAREVGITNVAIEVDETEKLLAFALEMDIKLTIVGPEAPLVNGMVDRFREAGLAIFGPTQAAAQLEGSKAFAKRFLSEHGIPTAHWALFCDSQAAVAHVRETGAPVVIKADALAAGKGVFVAQTEQEAIAAIEELFSQKREDEPCRVVIEEFLVGEEVSFIAMVDGLQVLPLATCQDHKALSDGDLGPNTGGMGAISPAPAITPRLHEQIMQNVMRPTVEGMAARGEPYTGFLYAGLMITHDGEAKVLEFNCRLGDPETQPLLMRMNSDLVELCFAATQGQLADKKPLWKQQTALGVVMAAAGYPHRPRKGDRIEGLDKELEGKVFHAGTATAEDGSTVTCGGRVLCVTVLADSATKAQSLAYDSVRKINWPGCCYRTDIGHRAVAREAR